MDDRARLVIDASVALKWFHKEEESPAALNLLDKINNNEIISLVPDLVVYEVANVLIRGIKKPLDEARTAIDYLARVKWHVIRPTTSLIKDAMQFASEHAKLSLYDASYVAVAMYYNAVVITSDRRMHKIVGEPLTQLIEKI